MSLPTPYYEEPGITIYHGDCREILPQLPNVDLVLTDPPYGIGYTNTQHVGQRKKQRALGFDIVPWPDKSFDRIDLIAHAGAHAIIWGGNYYGLPSTRAWLCWLKPDAPPSMGHFELAWTNLDICTRLITHSISATNQERVGHPTQKPLAVFAWCLSFVPLAQTILDPFMGSGTTLRAAKDLGRQCIGIELEEKYCEIAVNRLRQEVLAL